jgi:hypothetical protein
MVKPVGEWKVEVLRTVGSSGHFAPLLSALKVVEQAGTVVELMIDQRHVTLSLRMHKGSVTGLDVDLDWPGATDSSDEPLIVLRSERADDVEGKEQGINREVQINDEAFDRQVYIDATASDREVRRVLSDIRVPVLELVTGGAKLKLTPKALHAHWSIDSAEQLLAAERLTLELTRLLQTVQAGPPSAADAIEPRGTNLPVWWGLALAPAAMLAWAAVDTWSGANVVEGTGAGLGALGALFLRRSIARKVSGDSGSYRRLSVTLWLAALVFALCGLSVATIANGALDTAPAVVFEGVVIRQHVGSKGARSHIVQWRDGSESTFSGASVNGNRVSQRRHPGALGDEWAEAPIYR